MFKYRHQVQFYETDMMSIVHHSNYLRIFEEARVAWAHEKKLISYQKPESAAQFAVLETHVRHVRPARFGDTVEVQVQAKRERLKIIFEYKMTCVSRQEVLSEARTVHVALGKDLKVLRLLPEMSAIMEKETWIETWLSSL